MGRTLKSNFIIELKTNIRMQRHGHANSSNKKYRTDDFDFVPMQKFEHFNFFAMLFFKLVKTSVYTHV